MASNYEGDPPLFNQIEDELVYWKARSKFFEDANNRKRSIVHDQEIVKDPVKKARLEIDPFKVFPQHVYELILNQVNNMDDISVYRLTKVSSCWNEAVQNYKPTAERIERIVHLQVDGEDNVIAPVLALWMETNFEIKYKSATIPFNDFGYNCLMKFASSLEEVVLSDSETRTKIQSDSNPRKQSVFIKLRMLKIDDINWKFFKQLINCNFPVLQKLKLPYLRIKSIDDLCQINSFFSRMPKLEQLCIRDVRFSVYHVIDKMLEAPFRLKSLCIVDYMENFIQLHADTLENFTIENLRKHKQIKFIIMSMKKLRFLSLGRSNMQDYIQYDYSDDSDSFIDYNDIENLYCGEEDDEEYYVKETEETIQNLSLDIKNDTITTLFIGQDLDELIKYVPALISLETLIIHEDLKMKHLKFIASNALKLKRIICGYIHPKMRKLFADFILIEDEMINKNIDIICNTSDRYTLNPEKTFCNFKMTSR